MKICLDAGHYGKYNNSPANRAYWESDFSWKFHLMLKAALERYGVQVITTRANKDKDLGLESRGRKAAGCDLFLSLHSNGIGSGVSSTDYPLACCCVAGTADVLGMDLAETVQRIMQTDQRARIIKKKGTRGDWYGVLRGAASVGVPGILLEHSFHTNLRATNWLLDDRNLERMAEAEAETIARYYGLTKQETPAAKPAEPTAQPASQPSAQPAPDPAGSFKVRIVCGTLNVRTSAGAQYPVRMTVSRNEVYTIVQTAKASDGGTWGRLKSGAGWINIGRKYCKRLT